MPGWAASRSAWDSLRTSFWFVPTLMGAGGAALTGISLLLEAAMTDRPQAVPWFIYVSAADNARDVTSTLLSSMMTMASLEWVDGDSDRNAVRGELRRLYSALRRLTSAILRWAQQS